MKFYGEKLKSLCKNRKITISQLSSKLGITRTTIWTWMTGETVPSEKKTRTLANALGVPVNEISDLSSGHDGMDNGNMPEKDKDIFSLWMSFGDKDLLDRKGERIWCINRLEKQLDDADKSITTLRALINFANVMLYIKDTSNKYIAVSKAFLEHTNYTSEESTIGKTDIDFYPAQEAEENSNEDASVLQTGTPVSNREGFIPGSRKKKMGIIAKTPLFNTEGAITGLIGSFIDITKRIESEKIAFLLKTLLNYVHDSIFWISREMQKDESRVISKNNIYMSNNKDMLEFLPDEARNLSWIELQKYIFTLRTDDTKNNMLDIDKVREKGVDEVKWSIKSPKDGHLIHLKSRLYYVSEYNVYLGIIIRDVVKEAMEKARSNVSARLAEHKISSKIIKDVISAINIP